MAEDRTDDALARDEAVRLRIDIVREQASAPIGTDCRLATSDRPTSDLTCGQGGENGSAKHALIRGPVE